jgi:hypothetical protein
MVMKRVSVFIYIAHLFESAGAAYQLSIRLRMVSLPGCSFYLEPVSRATAGVLRIDPLRNESFQPSSFKFSEQCHTIT